MNWSSEEKEKTSNRPLRDLVYDSILDEIIHGQFKDQDIITEKELISRHQVSKSPVRDALIELCNEEILRSIPRCGYVLVHYGYEDVHSISEFRSLLEPSYLAKNWHKITVKDKEELRRLVAAHSEKAVHSGPDALWRLNMEFHLKLASFYGDHFFLRMLELTLKKSIVAISQQSWHEWNQRSLQLYAAQHERIAEALLTASAEEACSWLRQDIIAPDLPPMRLG